MVDYDRLFAACWEKEARERAHQSPSYTRDQYVATGRAAKEFGGKRNEAWWLANGGAMVKAWHDWRRETGWRLWEPVQGVPAVELELHFSLPSGRPYRAFVDRVFVLPTGEPAILDIKSGRIPETAEQLGLYAEGIRRVYGVSINWGYYWNPDKGHGSPLDLSLYTGAYLDEIAAGAVAGINAGSFLAKPANNCKNWCGVAQFCPAVGGTMPAFLNRK